ncbi:RNA polymerase I-specific transcription initiation factor RRN3-domain-containing protein [Mrakia frigida]|uniref:rDNA-binding RNA polymerase I transcriptional factor n=1 Tax=Mrakia frigida TaxID=29902 RepID=UPI003FCC09F7
MSVLAPPLDNVYRTQSVIGKKRSRPSDSSNASPAPRRTKSVSDARSLGFMSSTPAPDDKGKGKEVAPVETKDWKKGMYGTFVVKALVDMENGIPETYNDLLSQIRPSSSSSTPLKTTLLLPLLTALSSHASLLSSTTHASLIQAIVQLPWTTADESFVRVYTTMIGVIVSLRMEWVGEVVSNCVRGLSFQSRLRALFLPLPSTSTSSTPTLTRGLIYNRIHSLLAHLITLIPTLPSIISPILLHHFPHKRDQKIAQLTYLRNALRVVEYCPPLADKVLAKIVERAIQIDVEIQIEWDDLDDDEDDDDDASDTGSLEDMDPFDRVLSDEPEEPDLADDDGSDEEDLDSDDDEILLDTDVLSEDEDEGKRKAKHKVIREMMSKLDVILNTTFEHFAKLHDVAKVGDANAVPSLPPTLASTNSSSTSLLLPPPQQSIFPSFLKHTVSSSLLITPAQALIAQNLRQSQFSSLLNIFDRLILKTYKSRYTQFLLFWFTSLSPSFTEEFQSLLLSRALFEKDQPDITRIASASYIASFVSRANWVERGSVREVVALLCHYLAAQMETARLNPEILDGVAGVRGQGGFGVFFAVSQAVFLIFCFRWKDLVEGEDGEMEMMGEDGEMAGRGVGGKRQWAKGLDVLEKVVSSPFNPLKVCSPNVVKQFARVANETSFLYVYHIIQANNRTPFSSNSNTNASSSTSSLLTPSLLTTNSFASFSTTNLPVPKAHNRPSSSTPGGQASDEADLDSFFPFDPYNLPSSSRFIQPIYVDWDAGESDDDDDDSSNETNSEVSIEDEENEAGDRFPSTSESLEDQPGYRIPPSAAATRRGRKTSGGRSGRLLGSLEDDEEMNSLGKSMEGAMSISPGMGLASRMGLQVGRGATGTVGGKEVRWV